MAGGKKRKAIVAKDVDESRGQKLSIQEFYSAQAMTNYRSITKRKVIQERGIQNKGHFAAYINSHGWQKLCSSPCHANMNMANEFYANMEFRDEEGMVLCRGKKVELTEDVINDFYGLKTDPELYSEWRELKKTVGVDNKGHLVGQWDETVRAVTLPEYPLEDILPRGNWGSIAKRFLTMDMNVWYYFVAARLLPVSINSEVQWERIRMLYALKKNIAIDVGSEILASMLVMYPTTCGLGFHSLITSLCHKAGCQDHLDDTFKKPMGILSYDAFNIRAKTEPKTNIDARMDRIESEVAYIKSLCEHTSKILAYNFPASINEIGPYPEAPVRKDPDTAAIQKDINDENEEKEDGNTDDEATP